MEIIEKSDFINFETEKLLRMREKMKTYCKLISSIVNKRKTDYINKQRLNKKVFCDVCGKHYDEYFYKNHIKQRRHVDHVHFKAIDDELKMEKNI